MEISEIKWTKVSEGLPKNNTTVVAIYLEPFMRKMTSQYTIAYYDTKNGWYSQLDNKRLKNVVFWSYLETPSDASFDISELVFNAKYSSDARGNVMPKLIRRSTQDHGNNNNDSKPTAVDYINLRRKFTNKFTKHEESLIEKMDAIRER